MAISRIRDNTKLVGVLISLQNTQLRDIHLALSNVGVNVNANASKLTQRRFKIECTRVNAVK